MKYAIGVDLGGTSIKYGLVDQDGKLVYENIVPTGADEGAEAVILRLISSVDDVQQYAKRNDILPVGIGVGTSGIVDRTNRIVLGGADNIVGWSQVPLSDRLETACHLPVIINNDANLMGLGEQAYGAARDCSDVLFITVGTGIGGAIIINNQLFGGYDNRGTELGHIPLFADGIACSCGSVGCLEAYASTGALIQQFKDRCNQIGVILSDEITGKYIIELYLQHVPVAVESVHEHCRFLGRGIAGLVNIFSPQRVVIGGGISESGPFYIEKVNEYYQQYVMPDCGVNTQLCPASLGNRAGILGAARWAFLSQ